jgi:hypothetical protein
LEDQEETILADASMEEIIQQFRELKDEKDKLNKEIKDNLNPGIEYLQGLIITRMQAEGATKISTDFGSCSIKTDIYPKIENFGLFIQYIASHNALELIQKRVSAAPYRAIIMEGGEVPGLGEYEDTKLNFRRK